MSSTNQDIKSAPDPPANAPYVPSAVEAELYLYGLYSMPRLIARSSSDVWIKPTGLRANFERKELRPLRAQRLDEVWEDTVAPAMDRYLVDKQVQWTSMEPLRIGIEGQPFSAVILIGVKPGTLSPELGLEAAVGCRSILVESNIDGIHIIISEPTCTYRPITSSPTHDPPATGNRPYVPSEGEAMYYLHGLPSEARFIARSSTDIWIKWRGSDGYLERKQLTPLGTHRLNEVWEDTVLYNHVMNLYCDSQRNHTCEICG
ncbi:unnamed protein product [Rhizoctonia solani]|uniref:Uncharacterized protein n=1 Tax=Rhizoctonia solani TaxID=456999 RepID=A0A8H3E664_9AGAM|nr:unnamed protein product [Rhizoctonia solani]